MLFSLPLFFSVSYCHFPARIPGGNQELQDGVRPGKRITGCLRHVQRGVQRRNRRIFGHVHVKLDNRSSRSRGVATPSLQQLLSTPPSNDYTVNTPILRLFYFVECACSRKLRCPTPERKYASRLSGTLEPPLCAWDNSRWGSQPPPFPAGTIVDVMRRPDEVLSSIPSARTGSPRNKRF